MVPYAAPRRRECRDSTTYTSVDLGPSATYLVVDDSSDYTCSSCDPWEWYLGQRHADMFRSAGVDPDPKRKNWMGMIQPLDRATLKHGKPVVATFNRNMMLNAYKAGRSLGS